MKYDPSKKVWAGIDVYGGLIPLDTGEFILVARNFYGDGRDRIVIVRRRYHQAVNSYTNTGYTIVGINPYTGQLDVSESLEMDEIPAPCRFGLAGDFFEDGRDAVAVAVFGSIFHVLDYSQHTLRQTVFDACPRRINTYNSKFAVAGDFDGDGRDEIAVANDAPGSQGNEFWVLDYDPWSREWHELSPIEWSSQRKSFGCSVLPHAAKRAVSGRFDGDRVESIAVLPDITGQPVDDFWILKLSVVPLVYPGPFSFSESLSDSALTERRKNSETALVANMKGNIQYIEEAMYFVPIYLALKLQESGQYVPALDLFCTVYNYKVPPDVRNIYSGLKEGASLTYDRIPGWLLDYTNPHRVAADRPGTYLRFTIMSLIKCLIDYADEEFSGDSGESLARAESLYAMAQELLGLPSITNYESEPGVLEIKVGSKNKYYFYVTPNLMLKCLRLHAENNLYKLHTGRNIAGIKRQLEFYTSASDTLNNSGTQGLGNSASPPGMRPTPYRYRVIIERARQIVQLAAQAEAAMLSALEKRDEAAYSALRARQDVRLTQAQIQLQNLRVNEAVNNKLLAGMQQVKALVQYGYYSNLLFRGNIAQEKEYIKNLTNAAKDLEWAALSLEDLDVPAITGFNLGAGWPISFGISFRSTSEQVRQGFLDFASYKTALASHSSTLATINQALAGFERRKEEWRYQRNLADEDIKICGQQINIAGIHILVTEQEKAISEVQAENAQAVVDFLSNKFTSAELYRWMGAVMERIYRFFLQQATAMARLASNQLAFERKEAPPGFIQADYWIPAGSSPAGSTDQKDYHGLTGSARLLQDIQRLDQFAFETDRRKHQITKTISLATYSPYEFQRFKETGVMTFNTPMRLFDQDFPGHYLRLIKRVKASVIALIPPAEGIKATLTSSGISRVVTGNDLFETLVIRRDPESVALSSPINATGLFELESQSEMMFPFEGTGVDTTWEFSMPRAANRFDYRTIADVLISIDYTALSSPDYRQQVIQQLGRSVIGDQVFSFRHQFPDIWYDLLNPEKEARAAGAVSFQTAREDFPSSLHNLYIQNVLLCFVPGEGKALSLQAVSLLFTPDRAGTNTVGGEAVPDTGGTVSILRGNAGNWIPMIGYPPVGKWTMALNNIEELSRLLQRGDITDIILVITYTGRLPEWPA